MTTCLTREGARNRLIGQCREAGSVERFATRHQLSRKHVQAIIDEDVPISAPVALAIGLQIAFIEVVAAEQTGAIGSNPGASL